MTLEMRRKGRIVKKEQDLIGCLWGEYRKKEVKDNSEVLNQVTREWWNQRQERERPKCISLGGGSALSFV